MNKNVEKNKGNSNIEFEVLQFIRYWKVQRKERILILPEIFKRGNFVGIELKYLRRLKDI